jgi:hypothetical protein
MKNVNVLDYNEVPSLDSEQYTIHLQENEEYLNSYILVTSI